MRSSTSLALFAASAAAQSISTGSLGAGSATIFNLFEYAPTLTLVGSDATATTYKNDCPASAGLPSDVIHQSEVESAAATITPAPMPRALYARQAMSDSPDNDDDDLSMCEPYTIKQGASTWEMHLTDPSPGVWTVDMNCNWKGPMTAADFTCTATVDGSYVESGDRGTSSTVMSSASVKDFEAIKTVAVVGASGTPLSSGTSPSASGSGASRSGVSVSGSGAAAATPSTGFAPARPLPTGALALVGGAAGVFAALAL